MTPARYIASLVLGSLLVAAILLSLGAHPAHSSGFAPPDSGSALVPDAVTPALPETAIPPAPVIDDVSDLWRRGEFVAAFIVGLFILCSVLPRVDPPRAWIYTAGVTVLGGCVASITAGITPNIGMLVGAAAALVALYLRGPASTVARKPESGRALVGLLALVASGGAVLLAAGAMWSCAPIKQHGKATASDVVDCSLVSIGEHADEVEAAIRDATNMDGSVNWANVRALLKQLGTETGGCALQKAIARILSSQSLVAPTPSKGALAAGWERMRVEVLEGRTFR